MQPAVIELLNLPDEVMIIVLKNLNNIDMLHSLVGLNNRLDRVVCDRIFTHCLALVTESTTGGVRSLSTAMLDRFCCEILPQIHYKVGSLILERMSMERILLTGDYPNLFGLTLIKLASNKILYHLTDQSPFARILQQQISRLSIVIHDDHDEISSESDLNTNVFVRILSTCTKLTHLSMARSQATRFPPFSLTDVPSNACRSSTLVELSLNLVTLDDCLCLLDGRLTRLRTLIVKIDEIDNSPPKISTAAALPTLSCFSMSSLDRTSAYDTRVVPLLRRMPCLEKLTLCLTVEGRSHFIDGAHLNNEICRHMPQLRTFIFHIHTIEVPNDGIHLPSADDIRQTFSSAHCPRVTCWIDYIPDRTGRCRIFTIPFTMDRLFSVSTSFPGGQFSSVRNLSLLDVYYPFEHQFFDCIARSFPSLGRLGVANPLGQTRKRDPSDRNLTSSIVEFSHLTDLSLRFGHRDYAEQFLCDNNTSLPCLVELRIRYESLREATHNFMKDATRVNCSRVRSVVTNEIIAYPETFYEHFPLL